MKPVYDGTFIANRWGKKTDVFNQIEIFAKGRQIVKIVEKRKMFKVEYTVYIKDLTEQVVEKIVYKDKFVEVPVEVVKIVEKFVEKDRLGNVIVGKGKSRFRGVSKKGDKFHASIQHNGRRKWLGSYTSEFAAAEAYDQAALKIHGEKAIINFNGVGAK